MNKLAAELVKGILSEAEVPRKEIIGMFGGGFKPPTVGHLEVVKRALDENPEMDKMIVLVGSGERDSITQEESIAIWRIYKKYLPSKVEIQPSPEGKPPIGAIYAYGKDNPDKTIYWFLGAREGNEDDSQDVIKRTKSLNTGKYPNIEVKQIATGGTVSGTKTRKALLNRDKETFVQALPDIPEIDQIWDMLSDTMGINEEKNPTQINDKFFVKKGAYIYHEGKKKRIKRGKYFEVKEINGSQYSLEDEQKRQFWIGKHEICDKWNNVSLKERVSFKPEFDETEVDFIEDFADEKMKPDVDIDLSGQHFFDRLNDPRNYPDIEPYELEDFFEKLADKKDEFITFLKKYKELVAKDKETNINIPFMKIANKAIAKTIMRKKNFLSKTPILPLEEGRYDQEVLKQSRFVINKFREEFGKEYEGSEKKSFIGYVGGKKKPVTYKLELYFYPTDFDTLGPTPYIINAGAGDEPMIYIQVNYNPDSFPKAYSELVPEIKDALRHEIEHISQYSFNKGVMPDGIDQDDLPLFDYLTLDYEIPAFVQGLYKSAKTKKITLTKAIQDFLDDRAEELSSEEEAEVMKIWTDWAKKNLPAAQFEGLSSKEKDVVNDILGEVNNLQEIDLDKVKEKLKYYGRKGMLTLSILLAVANGLQANPGVAKDVIDTGIEMVDTNSKTDFYNAIIGYAQKVIDSEMGPGGNIELIGALKEVKLHYEALRDNKTPTPLSKTGQAALNSIAKHLSQSNKITDYTTFGATVKTLNEADPKKGTGKKPKGSGRRLYTDEDPSDTVKVKFSTRQDIVDTLSKKSFKAKSHARQSQVINLIHQRTRAAYNRAKKPEVKKRLKTALDYITKRKEASKAKTQRLNKQKKNIKEFLLEVIPTDVINSFDIQDTLVQDVWDGEKLKPEVKEKLLKIAQDFFESLDLPENIKLKDIKLTGSLANYNWSKFSDFDLHLVLDFSDVDDDEEFVRNYFMAKKGIWNDAHDITIYGFPVEVYVENEGESHTASGLYSILNDKWIVVPKKKEVMIDKDDISTKAEDYISQTEDVQDLYDEGKYEEVITKVDKIKERLRNMRSSGLEKGGEYSVENLAFKVLRRADIIGQLNDLKSKSYDTIMTINENTAPNHNQKSSPYGSGYKILKEDLTPSIASLTQYMENNGLNLRPYPKVKFISNDIENANDLLGRTAYYDPNTQLVALYTMGRHPKDILRSYAHELIHHHQNLNGTLNHNQTTNTNEDGNLDRIEREAYENGNILFRNWEDQIKNEN